MGTHHKGGHLQHMLLAFFSMAFQILVYLVGWIFKVAGWLCVQVSELIFKLVKK